MFPGSGIQDIVWDQLRQRRASSGLGALLGDFLFFRADTYLASGANVNILMAGYRDGVFAATTTSRSYVLPRPGILSGLYVRASQVGVGTGSAIFTVRASAGEGLATADTAITCTVPISDDPNIGIDDVNTFEATSAGAIVQLNVRRSGSGTFTTPPERARAMLIFTPT